MNDPNGTALLALLGFAGSGKSTIAASIAQYFDEKNVLGSSIFFDRAHQTSRGPHNLFSTIARDIARLDPAVMQSLLFTVKHDPSLRTSLSPYRQFDKLLAVPANSSSFTYPVVIVIDALDESGDRDARHLILSILKDDQNYISKLPKNIRILITSRPEQDITDALGSKKHATIRHMQEIAAESTNRDILSYIESELPNMLSLDKQWPNHQWQFILVQKSEGLFQWVATACRFIKGSGKAGRNAEKQFRLIDRSDSSLIALYLTILRDLFGEDDDDVLQSFSTVMGQVLAAKVPLSLATLTALSPNLDTDTVLAPMGSLLTGVTGDGPILPLHTSLRDFLLDREQSGRFHMDSLAANRNIASSALDTMNSALKFDICHLETSHIFNEYVIDIKTIVEQNISKHLSYSCRFWADHLAQVESSDALETKLSTFFYEHLLHWLEALSLLVSVPVAIPALIKTSKWTQVSINFCSVFYSF